MTQPLVSVCMMAYNLELYIEEAIQSILKQQINGKIELVIGDDASTDNTPVICKSYAAKYPEVIKYNRRPSNVGLVPNWIATLSECKGKYVAKCDADDYWTDPLKLQKQVDVLEKHPEFSACFHDVLDLYPDGSFGNTTYCSSLTASNYNIIDVSNFVSVPALSMVFRNNVVTIPDNFNELPIEDWPYLMLLAEKGNLFFLKETMGVYRKHEKAINSLKPAHVQNKYKIKELEVVSTWFKDKNKAAHKNLQKQLSKSYYYQCTLLLKDGQRPASNSFYKKLISNLPWHLGIGFKLKYPIKYLVTR